MSPTRARLAPFALTLAFTLAALGTAVLGTARAEATVQVEVRPAANGTVTVTPNAPGARSYSCHTTAAAPRAIASAIKRRPSAIPPG